METAAYSVLSVYLMFEKLLVKILKKICSKYVFAAEKRKTVYTLFQIGEKPNIMSRHNVVYVEACSFDNPLGGFVPGTKSTNKILKRSLLCKSRKNRLIRPSIPRHSSGESSNIQRSFILGTCIDIK